MIAIEHQALLNSSTKSDADWATLTITSARSASPTKQNAAIETKRTWKASTAPRELTGSFVPVPRPRRRPKHDAITEHERYDVALHQKSDGTEVSINLINAIITSPRLFRAKPPSKPRPAIAEVVFSCRYL